MTKRILKKNYLFFLFFGKYIFKFSNTLIHLKKLKYQQHDLLCNGSDYNYLCFNCDIFGLTENTYISILVVEYYYIY